MNLKLLYGLFLLSVGSCMHAGSVPMTIWNTSGADVNVELYRNASNGAPVAQGSLSVKDGKNATKLLEEGSYTLEVSSANKPSYLINHNLAQRNSQVLIGRR